MAKFVEGAEEALEHCQLFAPGTFLEDKLLKVVSLEAEGAHQAAKGQQLLHQLGPLRDRLFS